MTDLRWRPGHPPEIETPLATRILAAVGLVVVIGALGVLAKLVGGG